MKRSELLDSLYQLLTKRYGLVFAGASQVIRAVNINKDQAPLLGVAEGTAVLAVKSIGYLTSNEPLWWEYTLYRGDAYEFRNHLGGIQAARRPRAGCESHVNQIQH